LHSLCYLYGEACAVFLEGQSRTFFSADDERQQGRENDFPQVSALIIGQAWST
jgi:hypothetical protein